MITRNEVISKAVDECFKEMYLYVQPKVDWKDFVEQNRIYSEKYHQWEHFKRILNEKDKYSEEFEKLKQEHPTWEESSTITECIGPRPYEFYYLNKDILKSICDSYIYAYNIDSQQELLNTINILKHYCREPIVDKYIKEYTDEYGNYHPGYRGYDNPDNLEKELYKLLREKAGFSITNGAIESLSKEVLDKFFEFLDMAGNFYNWNHDLNSFNTSVYLGSSPHSNKEEVIKNWKKYRNQEIKINEKQMLQEYYGEDDEYSNDE